MEFTTLTRRVAEATGADPAAIDAGAGRRSSAAETRMARMSVLDAGRVAGRRGQPSGAGTTRGRRLRQPATSATPPTCAAAPLEHAAACEDRHHGL